MPWFKSTLRDGDVAQAGLAGKWIEMVRRRWNVEPPSLDSVQTGDPVERRLNAEAFEEFGASGEPLNQTPCDIKKIQIPLA